MVDGDVTLAGMSALVAHRTPFPPGDMNLPLPSEGIDKGARLVEVFRGFEGDFSHGERLIRQSHEDAGGFATIGVAIART